MRLTLEQSRSVRYSLDSSRRHCTDERIVAHISPRRRVSCFALAQQEDDRVVGGTAPCH